MRVSWKLQACELLEKDKKMLAGVSKMVEENIQPNFFFVGHGDLQHASGR